MNFKQLERRGERLGINVGRSNAGWRGEHEDGTVSRYYVNVNGHTVAHDTLKTIEAYLDRYEGKDV
jgi:hypothetical protein